MRMGAHSNNTVHFKETSGYPRSSRSRSRLYSVTGLMRSPSQLQSKGQGKGKTKAKPELSEAEFEPKRNPNLRFRHRTPVRGRGTWYV